MRYATLAMIPFCWASACCIGTARADELLRLGRVATLAPLCGLRDEDWSFDLRRAELQAATGSTRSDDRALRAAPDASQAVARLSWAEHEALEEFANKSPAQSCMELQADVDVLDGDRVVQAFRERRGLPAGS